MKETDCEWEKVFSVDIFIMKKLHFFAYVFAVQFLYITLAAYFLNLMVYEELIVGKLIEIFI